MALIRKQQAGSDSHGHVWGEDGAVVDIGDAAQVAALMAIPDGGFCEVTPPGDDDAPDDDGGAQADPEVSEIDPEAPEAEPQATPAAKKTTARRPRKSVEEA